MKFLIRERFLDDVYVLSPTIHEDQRGYFYESWNTESLNEIVGDDIRFVQDNISFSKYSVLRGLHYQTTNPQGKLISVLDGEIFDVAVDLRKRSRNFMKWCGVKLDSTEKNFIWIPPGYAHGFQVLSKNARILYKTTNYWHQGSEKTILWNDPDLNITWPINQNLLISNKDLNGDQIKNSVFFE